MADIQIARPGNIITTMLAQPKVARHQIPLQIMLRGITQVIQQMEALTAGC